MICWACLRGAWSCNEQAAIQVAPLCHALLQAEGRHTAAAAAACWSWAAAALFASDDCELLPQLLGQRCQYFLGQLQRGGGAAFQHRHIH
jgi:hypothetical protein